MFLCGAVDGVARSSPSISLGGATIDIFVVFQSQMGSKNIGQMSFIPRKCSSSMKLWQQQSVSRFLSCCGSFFFFNISFMMNKEVKQHCWSHTSLQGCASILQECPAEGAASLHVASVSLCSDGLSSLFRTLKMRGAEQPNSHLVDTSFSTFNNSWLYSLPF